MNRELKRGCLIVCLLLAALIAHPVYKLASISHYYGEAEPLADCLAQIWREVSRLEKEGEPLPHTLEELLALLPEEDRKRFHGYQMTWNPEADPRFKMRINARFGFTLTRDQMLWITKPEELDALFPKP